jgi:hypothetical protein
MIVAITMRVPRRTKLKFQDTPSQILSIDGVNNCVELLTVDSSARSISTLPISSKAFKLVLSGTMCCETLLSGECNQLCDAFSNVSVNGTLQEGRVGGIESTSFNKDTKWSSSNATATPNEYTVALEFPDDTSGQTIGVFLRDFSCKDNSGSIRLSVYEEKKKS